MPRRLAGPVLLLAVLVVGLGAAELIARRSHPAALPEAILARLERERNGLRTPDAEFHHVGNGIFHLDFPAASAGSLPRILVVGDSFAMGHGVGREDRFGTRLAQHMRGVAEVDVLASTSYSPIVYRNIVRHALTLNRYATVAIFVDQTDPSDDVVYRKDLVGQGQDQDAHEFDVAMMRERIQALNATYDRIEASFSGVRGLARKLALVNVLLPVPSILDAIGADSPYHDYVELSLARLRLTRVFEEAPESSLAQTMVAGLFLTLDETVTLARSSGAQVILAANPWEDQVSAAPRVPRGAGPYPRENRLERLLVERYGKTPGIVVLDLTAAFRADKDPSHLFLDNPSYEVHWNRAGHDLVASVLEHAIETTPGPGPDPQWIAGSGPVSQCGGSTENCDLAAVRH